MIIIALGANLPSEYGTPAQTLRAAYDAIENNDIKILKKSRIWLTAPVPFDPDQDWYHNSVISVETDLPPHDLLDVLLNIEQEFGRVRSVKNAPRVLDLDIIAYEDRVIRDDDERLIIPHPRMHERLFVLKPLADIDEYWAHPVREKIVKDFIGICSKDQQAKPLETGEGSI